MDASVHRNEKAHLPIDQGDKHEAAWTRTLLDWDGKDWRGSKQMVVKLTGCSDGTVAMMRRVVKWHHNYKTGADKKHPMGERLYTRLAACRTEGSILVSAADGVADHGDRGDHSGCR